MAIRSIQHIRDVRAGTAIDNAGSYTGPRFERPKRYVPLDRVVKPPVRAPHCTQLRKYHLVGYRGEVREVLSETYDDRREAEGFMPSVLRMMAALHIPMPYRMIRVEETFV